MASRVLVIDDDQWIQRVVACILQVRGTQVVAARDGEQGLQLALSQPFDLIIVDVMLPKMDGWTVVRQLRSRPELTLVPVVFLTGLDSAADRIQAYRLGGDDYLVKPFNPEELDLRVHKAMRRREEVLKLAGELRQREESLGVLSKQLMAQGNTNPGEPPAPPDVQGSLKMLGIASLLSTLEMEKRSGVLVLVSANSNLRARLFLRQGQIVRAGLDGPRRLINRDAIYSILRWTEGRFEFNAADIAVEDDVKAPTTALLIEGARRLDEIEAATQDIDRLLGG
jgi:DNA-binding response OmpR family regulator